MTDTSILTASFLLVGNCVLDQVWELDNFPQQDEEKRALDKTRVLGGNACNSAQILAKLGQDVELVSSLAEDPAAQWILQELSRKHISTRYCVQKAGFCSPESSILLNRKNGSRTIVHYRDLPELSVAELQNIHISPFEWIHFEGRNVVALLSYLSQVSAVHCPISLEIEKNREGIEDLLPFVDTVIVSSAYLQAKKITAEQCLEALGQINPAMNIVCTLGASGIVARDKLGQVIKITAEKVDRIVDTVGAGDCFIAGLIYRLQQQYDFASALVYANKLAAQKIQLKGMKIDED